MGEIKERLVSLLGMHPLPPSEVPMGIWVSEHNALPLQIFSESQIIPQ